ncbi:MAG: hypothetical protein JNN07_03850 [Verrucomicrobiales bacterium]|nr:hypothetical protein [Verrucomicrobiales bacterium]
MNASSQFYLRRPKRWQATLALAAASLCWLGAGPNARAGTPLDVRGLVTGADGDFIEGAAVYVFTAQPKDGKSIVCPSCYPDCAKHTQTDTSGKFVLSGLDSDLDFRLLVVAKGHLPRYIRNVDPEAGSVEASLKPITFPKALPEHRIVGKLLDPEGKPLAGAIVEVEGARYGQYSYTSAKNLADPIAATDAHGEFLFTCKSDLKGLLVTLKPRGLAREKMWLDVGKSYLIPVKTGVTVTGRLLNGQRPMSELTLDMSTQERSMENYLANLEIATDEEGRFKLEHVPARRSFWITTQMKEVISLGATLAPHAFVTGDNGSTVDLGDLAMRPSLSISGKVVMSDGKPIPEKTRLSFSLEDSNDSAQVTIEEEGDFEIRGIPPGRASLWLRIPGYRLSAKNPNKDWLNDGRLLGVVSKNLEDFTIHLEPGERFDQNDAPPDSERYPRDKPLQGAPAK